MPTMSHMDHKSCIIAITRVFLEAASNEYLCVRNEFGQTALHLAVREENMDILDVYIERALCLNIGNKDGDTPLHYASYIILGTS